MGHTRLEVHVFGRVQMVMFRDFAQRKAKGLSLVGEVQNLKDGSVRVIAEGTEEKLALFLEKLKKGPLLAKVKRVEHVYKDATQTFTTFSIVYGER